METMSEAISSWKDCKGLDDAKGLIDQGSLLSWKDVRGLKKSLSNDEQIEFVQYVAVTLAERVESRLPEEILIESLLIYLANSQSEEILNSFLEELVQQPNAVQACELMVELSIAAEISDTEHYEDIFSMAVALTCELGNLLQHMKKQDSSYMNFDKILDHISTYLLSVSNSNNNCIRLSLVHYFGAIEAGSAHKPGFNRIMSRFGHTVLEHLFSLLFNKKTEGVALQFLLDCTPYILEGDNQCQKILHETWKYYMLKKPERFSLFIQTLTTNLLARPRSETAIAQKMFLQHLGVLLKIVSEVNHKKLGREIMWSMGMFKDEPFRNDLLGILSKDKGVREAFRTVLLKLMNSDDVEKVLDDADGFRSSKRGRKPSFAKSDRTKPIYQATFLGHQSVARAS